MLGAISGASLAMREPDSGRRNGRRGLFHVRPDSAGAHLDTSRWRAALGVNGWEDSVRAGLLGPVRAEWPRSGCIEAGPALTGRFAGFTPPAAFPPTRACPTASSTRNASGR